MDNLTNQPVLILGIESSCDETAASVVKNGTEVLSYVIASSASIHRQFGGVVPEIASRQHVQYILPVINQALADAGIDLSDIDAIAVTQGPGLIGSLLVGVTAAKTLAFCANKPLLAIHHLAGHIAANYLTENAIKPPYLALIVSGAHSHIVEVVDYTHFRILARTRDDAPGEAFDKIAREMGIGYPGGPIVDQLAKNGNENYLALPHTKFSESFDYSFSGIKTATLNHLNKLRMQGQTIPIEDICASFQKAVCDTLLEHFFQALQATGYQKAVIAGGVSANSYLRTHAVQECQKLGYELSIPPLAFCTDNAAMIAAQGYHAYCAKNFADTSFNPMATMSLANIN